MSSSPTSPEQAEYSKALTPPINSEQKTHGPARLEESVQVIQGSSQQQSGQTDTLLSPARTKALLTRMTVTYEGGSTYSIEDDTGTHTVNPVNTECSCYSTLPDRGQRCEHLHHLFELDNREELPGPSLTEPVHDHSDDRAQTQNRGSTQQCPHCERDIGNINALEATISFATCNVCALENDDIYHLQLDSETDPELVYFNRLICDTTAESYYHNNATMAVYEFFSDHPDVSPDDSVVLVHQRNHAPNCTGLTFESEITAVPSSLLTKAIENLREPNETSNTANTQATPESTPIESEKQNSLSPPTISLS